MPDSSPMKNNSSLHRSPLISVLHGTARPHLWQDVYDDFKSKSVLGDMEYIVGVDEDQLSQFQLVPGVRFAVNCSSKSHVNATNAAAKLSTGKILVVTEDDIYPCQDWDRLIVDHIGPTDEPRVLWINRTLTGQLIQPVLTRPFYERFGYIWHPDYRDMYSDNDFDARARRFATVVDARDHILWEHRHHSVGYKHLYDDVAKRHESESNYVHGRKLFEQRVREGFIR